MITNKVVASLLAGLAILSAICAVLLGFTSLLSSLNDTVAASALTWIGMGCVILLITNALLLIAALAVRSLEQNGRDD